MSDLKDVPVQTEGFCVRVLGEETIFLARKGDVIHSLDAVGSFIWQTMDGSRTLAEIIDLICTEYEVPREVAEADLLAFADEMLAKDLVTLEPAKK